MALYYLPLYAHIILHRSPLQAGVDMLAGTLMILPGSMVVAFLIRKYACYRPFIWSGWLMAVVGAGTISFYDQHTTRTLWIGGLSAFGTGMGMVLSSVNFAVQSIVNAEYAAHAAATYAFSRSLGMSFGVVVGSTVFQNFMQIQLHRSDLPDDMARQALIMAAAAGKLGGTKAPTGLIVSYVHGFWGVFAIMAMLCGFGFLLSLFIKHHDMGMVLPLRNALRGDKDGFSIYSIPDVTSRPENPP